ncbi:hypothetical protein Taro_055698 [Colocasia esculenta]|uniref:Uncharacterized protein n=1 Tax=Colocasia esculenta TaxID=4460 RepID=A0A843XU29_COLES|nr:hypothetical protein [Colocasia esculenta]
MRCGGLRGIHPPQRRWYQNGVLAVHGATQMAHSTDFRGMATREPMSTETENSPVDDKIMFVSRNSGIDTILSNPRPHRVSFLCESAASSSACVSRQPGSAVHVSRQRPFANGRHSNHVGTAQNFYGED